MHRPGHGSAATALVAALAAALLAGGAACRREAPAWRPGDTLRLAGERADLVVEAGSGRIALVDHSGLLLGEIRPGGLSFETANGRRVPLAGFETLTPAEASELVARTDYGPARVSMRWIGPRTAELLLRPPPAAAARAAGAALALQPDEAIYGLSERIADSARLPVPEGPALIDLWPREVGGIDRRGERVAMWVVPTVSAYAPLYESSNGYGLFVDGFQPGEFDVGRSERDVLSLRFETAPDAPEPQLRLLLFAGAPAQVLDAYTAATGRPVLPPEWAFRHWLWHDEHRVDDSAELDGLEIDAQVAEDLRWHRELGLEPGVYVFDRPWTPGAFGFHRPELDPRRFPNGAEMLRRLAAGGWHTMVWSTAWAMGDAPGDWGTEARRRGFLAPGSDRILDLTNPDAVAWWKAEQVALLRALGFHGVKLDRGEEHLPSSAGDRWADGRSGREVHNAIPNLQLRLYSEALREAWGDDQVLVARAAYGGQQYGVLWGGDATGTRLAGRAGSTDLGLRSALISQLRVGFLGFPVWGSDVGGYYGFEDREVFARWLEFGAFCPIFEIGGIGSHWPWAMPGEPHRDEALIAIYRRMIHLHDAMAPYLRASAETAARTGLPVARALVFDHPDDPEVRDLWDEYLLGDALLVAPVWRSGARERDVYLPAGSWEDYWDPARHVEGPAHLHEPVPLEHIPVFVRAGARVPGRASALLER